ncbi:MAG: hypothetical protein ABR555_10715 [Pyrinomonadaceae bacterium]
MTRSNERTKTTRSEFILSLWRQLGSTTVGEGELEVILEAVREYFGEEAVDSPASIARLLADAGAQLRHQEVLDFDGRWRERQLYELFRPEEIQLDDVSGALETVSRIEALQKEFEVGQDQTGLHHLRYFVKSLRDDLRLVAQAKSGEPKKRLLAEEVSEWLFIWLGNPKIFPEWIELRLQSPAFIQNFGGKD